MESSLQAIHNAAPSESMIQDWVRKTQAGDEEAYSCLVKTFAPRLQGILYRMLLDWEETHDVVQETFVKGYQSIHSYKPHGSFQGWLFQVGTRKALDFLRHQKRRPPLTGSGDELLKNIGRIDGRVERNELIGAIERAVGELPLEQRTAFILSEYEGYGHQEIAAVIGGSAKRAEMHIYRARQALKDKLKDFL